MPYAIVRPCALADGPGAATGPVTERELELAQGDNVRGKVARADVAALCVAALHCPEVLVCFVARTSSWLPLQPRL